MALPDDLHAEVSKIFAEQWEKTAGRVVPAPSSVGLGNKAIEFDEAVVLYADLDGSTSMVDTKQWWFSAEIYKTFLHCAAKIIKARDGVITAYDGDRVMAVFIGEHKCSNAVTAALQINNAVVNVINPALKAKYPNADFVVRHVVGVDMSSIRAARTGVRGDNDLVWVGRAANYAAKLTSLPSDTPTWITADVYDRMRDSLKTYNGQAVWQPRLWTPMNNQRIYCSSWYWAIA
jgi:class 3 adenylate cyclase